MSTENGAIDAFANVAVTDLAPAPWTTHAPVPVQAPSQPVNTDAPSGVAVSVTGTFDANSLAHVGPQPMPAGLLVTVPLPVVAGLATVIDAATLPYAAATSSVPKPQSAFGVPIVPNVALASDTGWAPVLSAVSVAATSPFSAGTADHSSATAPATCGPAIDVPLNDA